MIDIQNYAGREQAYVKHYFLEHYLDNLLYKVARRHKTLSYVDGYAGPWLSADENYNDTSFGIALGKLRAVKERLKSEGVEISVNAFLVEENSHAYGKLEAFKGKFPDVTIHTFHGDFHSHLTEITRLTLSGFTFVFIDPKGWSVDVEQLEPLISQPHTEVVFNFMFDFINRFISLETVENSLAKLFFKTGDWRTRIETAQDRKSAVIECFRDTLSSVGNYNHCLHTEVLKTDRDRLLYALVYASRHPKGLEVFRDAQVKALTKQGEVRSLVKHEKKLAQDGQDSLFDQGKLGKSDVQQELVQEELLAKKLILNCIRDSDDGILYEDLVGCVLSKYIIRKVRVGQIIGAFVKDGDVRVSNFGQRQRVPKDGQRIYMV